MNGFDNINIELRSWKQISKIQKFDLDPCTGNKYLNNFGFIITKDRRGMCLCMAVTKTVSCQKSKFLKFLEFLKEGFPNKKATKLKKS